VLPRLSKTLISGARQCQTYCVVVINSGLRVNETTRLLGFCLSQCCLGLWILLSYKSPCMHFSFVYSVLYLHSLKHKMTFPSCRENLSDDKNMTVHLFKHGCVVWSVIKCEDFGCDFGFDYFNFCRAETVWGNIVQSTWLLLKRSSFIH